MLILIGAIKLCYDSVFNETAFAVNQTEYVTNIKTST